MTQADIEHTPRSKVIDSAAVDELTEEDVLVSEIMLIMDGDKNSSKRGSELPAQRSESVAAGEPEISDGEVQMKDNVFTEDDSHSDLGFKILSTSDEEEIDANTALSKKQSDESSLSNTSKTSRTSSSKCSSNADAGNGKQQVSCFILILWLLDKFYFYKPTYC